MVHEAGREADEDGQREAREHLGESGFLGGHPGILPRRVLRVKPRRVLRVKQG
jgi:hypothetical protein